MKAYFVIEARKGKKEGFFINRDDWHVNEFEIPEWATQANVDCVRADDVIHTLHKFPLPRPKKKVKKWRWVISPPQYLKDNKPYLTIHLTEEEAREIPDNMWVHRIDETKIEVEE